jgi:hypothetical protein
MLFVIPGLLMLLSARTLARWGVAADDVVSGVAPIPAELQVDALRLWTWAYRTTGLFVMGLGLLALCLPMES